MRNVAVLSLSLVLAGTLAWSRQEEREKGQTGAAPQAGRQPPDSSQAAGQTPTRNRQDSPAVRASEIPANAEIHAVLDTPLSSRTSRAGDRFTATLSQPVRDSSGATLIPTGSKLMGEVAENGSLPQGRGQLAMRFSEILLPHGQKVSIASTLSMGGAGNKEVNLPAQTPLVLRLEKTAMVPAYGKQ